jgi:hypothetical protein
MKQIGIIENNYYVFQTAPKKFNIEFQVDNHKVSLDEFEFYDKMSEETLCFTANLIINGKNVGVCRNYGRGGCAFYSLNNSYEMVNKISRMISKIPNYSFPKLSLSLCDVIDELANIIVTFNDNEVKTITRAKEVIIALNKTANKYKELYS